MVTFGVDVSHWQGPAVDFAALRREGIEFAIIKATEGDSFTDSEFLSNLRRARAAGMLVAAYHYVRIGVSAVDQAARVRRVVPIEVPVIPDVERNSGGIVLTRAVVSALRANGYRVPLLYLPRWYWAELGSPSLAGLPPLWASRYPNNVQGALAAEWSDVPAHYWNGYGGLEVAVLQFTSSARIAGMGPLDANAYRGTREQLAALLSGTEERNMRDLIVAREVNASGQPVASGAHWVGDGIRRRRIENTAELDGLRHWIKQRGGDNTIHDFADLRVLGVEQLAVTPVELDYARFVDDVSERVTDSMIDRIGTITGMLTLGVESSTGGAK